MKIVLCSICRWTSYFIIALNRIRCIWSWFYVINMLIMLIMILQYCIKTHFIFIILTTFISTTWHIFTWIITSWRTFLWLFLLFFCRIWIRIRIRIYWYFLV